MEQIIALVRRIVVMRMPWSAQLALALTSVAFATLSRWMLDRGANGVPFASFFPFIVLASIVLELRYAILVAVGSLVAVSMIFLSWDDPSPARAGLGLGYLVTTGLIISIGQVLRATVRDLNAKVSDYEAFNRELQHRARNALQLVGAMASRASLSTSPQQFFADLTGRIGALVRANDFLGIANHKRGDLGQLLRLSVAPFDCSAIAIDGPDVEVEGNVGIRLMMAIHELGTNATKYGALSCVPGTVEIIWTIDGNCAQLIWRERDGPAVVPPTKRGMGSRLLAAHAPLEHVDVDFSPDGVVCTMRFPARLRDSEI